MFLKNSLFYIAKRAHTTIGEAFLNADIVPEIISKPPAQILELNYHKRIRPGTQLKPAQVAEKPSSVRWRPVDYSKLYTLCMTEPESPFRTDAFHREWLHWLIVNIKGDLIYQGDTIAEYLGAGPPKNTGPHRYVYFIFQQPRLIDITKEPYLDGKTSRGRNNFSISSLQIKHDLSDPVAGNYFYSQYDNTVPEFYKRLEEGERRIFQQEQVTNEKMLYEIKQKRS